MRMPNILPNALIVLATVLGVAGLARAVDATTSAVGIAALAPSTTALPFAPVGVTLGPGHHGLSVASNGYAYNTTVYTTDTDGLHWAAVLSVKNLLTGAYWTNWSLQTIWLEGIARAPKPSAPIRPILWHSTDGGRSWTRIVPMMPPKMGVWVGDWTGVVWSAPRVGWAITMTGTVLRSVDGGHRWTVVSTFGHQAMRHIQFVNSENGWALGEATPTTSSTLWQTSNGGRTWQRQRLPGYVDGLDFVSATQGWAAGGMKLDGRWIRTIWSTRDRGQHWTMHDLGVVTNADAVMADVTAASRRVLWATSGLQVNSPPVSAVNQPLATHLWVSDNGGRTWTSVTQPKSVSAVSLPQFVGPTAGWSLVLGTLGPIAPEYLYQWQAAHQQWVPVQ